LKVITQNTSDVAPSYYRNLKKRIERHLHCVVERRETFDHLLNLKKRIERAQE